jgi:hypothetical protein
MVFRYEINVDPDLIKAYRQSTFQAWKKMPQFRAFKEIGLSKRRLEDCPVTDTTHQI